MPKKPWHSANLGGKREGAGRPKATRIFSDEVKRDFLRAAKKKANETGKSLGDVVMDIAYGEKTQDSVRIAAVKCFNEVVVIRESVKTLEALPGVVELPVRDSDPADAIGKKVIQ